MSELPITGEVSNSKLVAVFDTAASAQVAASALYAGMALQSSQVQIILPGEPQAARKLEPESRGIWRTIVVAHARLGLIGAISGALAFAALYWIGIQFITQNPWAASLILIGYGGVAGLFLGGLMVLRPDHDRYIQAARDAQKAGRAALVLHALSRNELAAADEILRKQGGEVTSTL